MRFDVDMGTATYVIRGYEPGKIIVNDLCYSHSLIISPEQLITDWPPSNVDDLTPEHLQALLPFKPDVILLGTGDQQTLLSPEQLHSWKPGHIGMEIMTTPAACRTYNVLMAEGRHVVAGLLMG